MLFQNGCYSHSNPAQLPLLKLADSTSIPWLRITFSVVVRPPEFDRIPFLPQSSFALRNIGAFRVSVEPKPKPKKVKSIWPTGYVVGEQMRLFG